jgi:ribosomal-protein-alanine N-acetyltransferase
VWRAAADSDGLKCRASVPATHEQAAHRRNGCDATPRTGRRPGALTAVRPRIVLRPPALSDQREFVRAARASRALHGRWVHAPDTPQAFRAYVQRMQAPGHHGFLVCRRDDGAIVGVVNISNVVMGLFCSAYLGYFAFAGHQQQGLMREGLRAVVRHAFQHLKLHRLEANIQPDNARSIALVRACGFRKEGYSPRYLKIAGRWRDHERWAIVAS